MSTNKTQNYQLHSWLPEDEFHLTEINENFTALDTALKNEAQTAATGRTSLNTALSGQIGQLNTTLSGQISQLNTALQSEITTRTQQINTKADKTEVAKKVEVVVGTYVGDGAVQRQISLARKPTFVHLEIAGGFRYGSNYVYGGLTTQSVNLGHIYNYAVINDQGFQLNNGTTNAHINEANQTYIYAAYYL